VKVKKPNRVGGDRSNHSPLATAAVVVVVIALIAFMLIYRRA